MIKKIFWPAVLVLIAYPILLIILGINYFQNHSVGWFELWLFIGGYYVSNISVGVGLHRLWAHNAFKVNKFVEFILLLTSAATLQGPALAWASDHYRHHTFTDTPQDPHSPLNLGGGVAGFLWSHVGWMLVGEPGYKRIDKITMTKLGKNKLLKWQLKYYWQIATLMNTLVPALIGYLIGGTLEAAYTGFLFIGLGRALQQQATFCVNSLCHYLGTKDYVKGTAGDIWWMALFLLGENWHNFHHAFPSDYRNGSKWYQFDVHKWIIYLLYRLGLASDLDVTPKVRILAKLESTKKQYIEGRKEQLFILKEKAVELADRLKQKFNEVENSSAVIKKNILSSFVELQESLRVIIDQLSASLHVTENPSEKILKLANYQLQRAEAAMSNLYDKFEQYVVKSVKN